MDFSIFGYAYALSGGIGVGKSSVCELLRERGYEIIDADKIAHQALSVKQQEIVEVFGNEILENGLISRALLGGIVFSNPLLLKRLEEIVQDWIRQEIFSQCKRLEEKKKIFFVEIPLLFEQRAIYNFKTTILVVASFENQVQRLCKRNKIDREEAIRRINLQLPLEKKIPLASFVIENNASQEELKEKIQNNLEVWLSPINQKAVNFQLALDDV